MAWAWRGAQSLTPRATVTLVVVSRLVYRKGIDLLVAAAPQICEQFPEVRFVVGECTWGGKEVLC